jgi:hypothetical protein
MNLIVLTALLASIPFINVETIQQPESQPDEETEVEEPSQDPDSFLDPYRKPDDGNSSCGCFESVFRDVLEVPFKIMASVNIGYNSDPWKFSDVRARALRGTGNPFAVDLEAGASRAGEELGWEVSGTFRFPSPMSLDFLYHDVRPGEGRKEFALLYAGIPIQLLFDSPLAIETGGGFLLGWEDDRDVLSGGYAQLRGRLYYFGGGSLAAEYRLAWLNGHPLHRGSGRLYWCEAPFSLWAGYTVLRNCQGDVLHGPGAGLGIFF